MSKEKKGLLKGLSGALPFDIQSTIGKVQAKIESISDIIHLRILAFRFLLMRPRVWIQN